MEYVTGENLAEKDGPQKPPEARDNLILIREF